jgi:hypothetical protein
MSKCTWPGACLGLDEPRWSSRRPAFLWLADRWALVLILSDLWLGTPVYSDLWALQSDVVQPTIFCALFAVYSLCFLLILDFHP